MGLPGEENSYFQAEDNFENIDITSKDITVLLVFYVLTAIEVGIFQSVWRDISLLHTFSKDSCQYVRAVRAVYRAIEFKLFIRTSDTKP